MAKNTSRPGRTLLIFFIAVAVLYGLAALGGTFKPKLGLDLEGGTSITLQVDAQKFKELNGSGQVPKSGLSEAAGIIRSRVNATGFSEASVATRGSSSIVVEVPGKNAGTLVDVVKNTALLRFRLVAASGGQDLIASGVPVTSTPTVTPSGTATGKATPKSTPTKKSTAKATATPNPRPAPMLAPAADTTPGASPTTNPSSTTTLPINPQQTQTVAPNAPAATPTTPATTSGASVDDPIKWQSDPGAAWIQKFAAYTCPAAGADSVDDNPNLPLITCDDIGQKFLLSKPVIDGTSLNDASAGIPQGQASWVVNLQLDGSATKVFANVSRALFANGGKFAIVLDGKVISYPGFNGIITDGKPEISGSFDEKSATSLANSLKYGSLPIPFQQNPRTEIIGPSLAGSQLSAGLLAGGIGLFIVMLYCLLYYRGLGLVVIASLFVAAAVTYATVLVLAKGAGFTLSLPGIAGLIVAVGITADSFIVYFERIRDEMRAGKSMRVAVEAGWIRARNTCLAADSVSLLAAVVLYIFAIDAIRGFAFALGISTLIDVAVFFWFTKPMVTLLARREFFNGQHRLSGLSPETLGIDGPRQPGLVGGNA